MTFRRPSHRLYRRTAIHALVLIGLLPKFLIPVGFMPAPLAGGSLLMLCDDYEPPAVGHEARVAEAAGHVQHGVHPTSAATDAAAGEQGADEHREWKRCSLGGLASLTAIGHDWRLAIPAGRHERTATPAAAPTVCPTTVAFHSRAPPTPA